MKVFLAMPVAVAVALAAAFAGAIPGPGANRIFLFASPNTQESLPDEDAKAPPPSAPDR